MDRLHQLEVFIAVVDESGFVGAARKMRISPPAVTRAINELERDLGVRLLTRTTRAVRVTEAGLRYAADCRRILGELVEADEMASGLNSTPRGRLTLTAPVLFGRKFVAPVLAEYLALYPDVDVASTFVDRVVNMLDEGFEVAVRIGQLPDSSLQAIRVGQVRRVIVASPDYLARRGAPARPSDLLNHDIVSANAVTPTSEWTLMDQGASCTVRLHPRMSTSTNDSAVTVVANGFGMARLLSYQVAEKLESGELVVVLEAFEPPALPVHVLHREGRQATQRVRTFLDLAIERLRANVTLNRPGDAS